MTLKTSRVFSIVLLVFLVTGMLLSVRAYAQETETEKYVKEVRFFLGKSEKEAVAWLQENGYEPILAETSDEASKENAPDGSILVPGIKRTADPDEAVTDFGVYVWNSEDASPDGDEWTALYTVTCDDAKDAILADSIIVQYGDDKKPEGCSRMLTLTPFATEDTKEAAEKICLFWNTEKDEQSVLPASSFSDGIGVLAATAGLMIGVIGTTIFLLPRRKKEEQAA